MLTQARYFHSSSYSFQESIQSSKKTQAFTIHKTMKQMSHLQLRGNVLKFEILIIIINIKKPNPNVLLLIKHMST